MKTTMNTTFSRPGRAARIVTATLVATLGLLACIAGSALGDVTWQVTSQHAPQNLVPGGAGQYVIQAFNIGDAPTSDVYTVTDTLPAGVTATGFGGSGWGCPTLGATVTCTHSGTASDILTQAGNGTGDAGARGAAPTLVLLVDVSGGASLGALAPNGVTVSGGSSGSALAASDSDDGLFSNAPAGFGLAQGSLQSDVFDAAFPGGSVVRQAGSHPFELRVAFKQNLKLSEDPDNPNSGDTFYSEPDGHMQTLETRLPIGVIGNPLAVPRCPQERLSEPGPSSKGFCPANTQVGSIDLVLQSGEQLASANSSADIPVYNIAPPPGAVAALAFSFIGHPIIIAATVDPSDQYAVIARIQNPIELLVPRTAELTLWGVPADPAHDALRMNPETDDATAMGIAFAGAPIKPFLTLPSICGMEGSVQAREASYTNPGIDNVPWTTATAASGSTAMTGCDDPRFRFDASFTARPELTTPSTPTGFDFDLSVPQKDDTVTDATQLYSPSGNDAAIATPPLRSAVVTLPRGMAVSPSSADGLAGCSSAQIALGVNAAPTCPDAAKVGSVQIDTPLLAQPLEGDVYLASQNDNPFGSLLAIYIVAQGPGVVIKLPGQVQPDPVTGQIKTTFDDNPQLPFTHLHLHFNSGARAPLVTSPVCGPQESDATFTSWNGSLPAVHTSDAYTISADGNGAPCGGRGFDPGFTAGTQNPVAGKDSPIITRFTRSDSDQELAGVDVSLPKGLLGRISMVTLCADAAATAGTCGADSKIGTVAVGAGPGPNPFYITDGQAFITGPYKGAPYGLSIVVHAKAGPLDLGNVTVRAQVQVDRTTAQLRVISDPLPTILQGIPLEVRVVNVKVDRPGFSFNGTNCSPQNASARLTSTDGAIATKTATVQIGDCTALPFRPKLSLTVGSKGHTRKGHSTPLVATVSSGKGQANLKSVQVTLPGTLNALLGVVNQACTLDAYNAGHCGNKARIGSAVAVTPVLPQPLRGQAFFVKNPKRALPDIMVALRGQVSFDLTGKVKIPGGKQLATNFDTVPDVPITKFTLSIVSGKNGPIGTAANLCTRSSKHAKAFVIMRGQNGKLLQVAETLHTNGCPKKKRH